MSLQPPSKAKDGRVERVEQECVLLIGLKVTLKGTVAWEIKGGKGQRTENKMQK
jgi:hypothetical protein